MCVCLSVCLSEPLLHLTALWCTLLHFGALYCTLVHFTALWCTLLHLTALYCTLVHFTTVWYSLIHFGEFYCTLVHFTAVWYISLHITAANHQCVIKWRNKNEEGFLELPPAGQGGGGREAPGACLSKIFFKLFL